ncbi:MAG TPA: 2-oxo-4-hydroxy-4-carboxy-5-ureidoimidazoline decarboxylase [Actinospica sp.]|nr:2-oxo-4-hydroxy-4-carboxy-5-ureidoimidazoline decarboxylase [Actinospica sp.]
MATARAPALQSPQSAPNGRRPGAGPVPEANAEGGDGVAANAAGTAGTAADTNPGTASATSAPNAPNAPTDTETGTDPGVAWLDALPAEDALQELSACCASRRWAQWVAAARPYRRWSALLDEAVAALGALDWTDVLEALAAHPVIGQRAERPADGESREATWSRAEQAGVDGADEEAASRLAALNLAYRQKFGHVFLICAAGLPAEVMLRALEHRLPNDAAAEQRATRAELAAITRLRLERLLAHAEASA